MDDDVETLLVGTFDVHPLAVQHARERNHTALVHRELDQFIGEHFLITVHGPLNPVLPLAAALRQTREVADRLEWGRLRPRSPFGLTYAIMSTVVRHQTDMVNELAREVGLPEQAVISAVDEEPQEFLRKLFTVRHALLTIKTMASARTDTKMTIAGEKLAVIAALTLPITAVLGMNVIVNDATHWPLLIMLPGIMFALALLLRRWAKRQGRW